MLKIIVKNETFQWFFDNVKLRYLIGFIVILVGFVYTCEFSTLVDIQEEALSVPDKFLVIDFFWQIL